MICMLGWTTRRTDLHRLTRQSDKDGKDVQQARMTKDGDENLLIGAKSMMGRFKNVL